MFGESLRLSPSEPIALHELQKQAQKGTSPLRAFALERIDEGLLDRGVGLTGSEAHDLARRTLLHLRRAGERAGKRRAIGQRKHATVQLNAASSVDPAPRFARAQMTCGIEILEQEPRTVER